MVYLKKDEYEDKSQTNYSSVALSTNAKKWGFSKRLFYVFVNQYVSRSFHFLIRVEVNGQENLKDFPKGTPLLLCGNHKSHFDSLIVGTTIINPKFKIRRFVCFMANGKVLNRNMITRKLKYFGVFPVYSDKPEFALKYTIESLKGGLPVVIFPQGGRVKHSSILSEYQNIKNEGKTGVGRVILRLNGQVPVVPFYVQGSEKIQKKGSIMPKWGSKVSLTFGKPLYFSNFTKLNGWDKNSDDFFDNSRIIVDRIMESIWQLLKHVESPNLDH